MLSEETALALAAAMWEQVRRGLACGDQTRVVDGALVPMRGRTGGFSEPGRAALEALSWLDSESFTAWCACCFDSYDAAGIRERLLAAWTGPDPTLPVGLPPAKEDWRAA